MCVTGSESEAKHETRLAQMRENTRNLVQFFSADAVSDITNAPALSAVSTHVSRCPVESRIFPIRA